MPAANAQIKVLTSNGAKGYTVIGTVTIGASPLTYTTGGITMPLADPKMRASKVPDILRVFGNCSVAGQGQFEYVYVPGSLRDTGLLKIFSAGVELVGASATPPGVSGDTINFEAIFKGMV